MLLIGACEKDFLSEIKKPETSASTPIIFNVTDTEKAVNFTQAELGETRQNSYTVENLAAAMNEVYGTTIQKVTTTHLYVKFDPQNEADIIALEELDLVLFDFPLEMEVLEMGDYYFVPAKENDCDPYCASWPCCLSGTIECNDDNISDWCMDFDPDCYPGSPNYPNCMGTEGEGEGEDPNLNDCGCVISSNRRHPGGCIRVEDTELGLEGLRNVQVIGYNGWFRIDRTSTDDRGCWSINRAYKGKAWFWIKFKNGGTKVCSATSCK